MKKKKIIVNIPPVLDVVSEISSVLRNTQCQSGEPKKVINFKMKKFKILINIVHLICYLFTSPRRYV